ncbi:uncharacterized protein [Littorina saxatilis]|uniref:G-protein coupled receptors family 1 profile domain-containing protein n=1 Tax=Littorina saxatilis TaxID=31220 RepID=A0AAN9B7I8_9CAEN
MAFGHDEYLYSAESRESRDYTDELQLLNSNSVLSRAVLIFLMMLMLMVGVMVNFVVTLVFLRRFPASAIRSYIVTMSVSDLIATGAGISLHIDTVLSAYNFDRTFYCKIYFAVVSFSTNCSSFIIVLMAMDRLRRVRRPTFKELDTIRSYYHVAMVVALSVLVTAPFVPMYGIYLDPTPYGVDLNVKMCWVDNMYKDTLYPTCYLFVLGLTFVGGFGLMCGSYFQIGRHIYRLARSVREELEYRRANPPPKSNLPDIYADDLEVTPEGVHILVTIPSRSHNFPHRPHASGEEMEGLIVPESPSNLKAQRPGKIKKLGNVISKIFHPVPDKATSSEGSSFVSTRMASSANNTIVKKSHRITSPSTSLLPAKNPEAGKGLAKPLETGEKLSLLSVNVQDTVSSTTTLHQVIARNINRNAVGETTDTATTSTFASPLPRKNRHQNAVDNLTNCLATVSAPTSTIARPLSQNRNQSAVVQLGFTTDTTPAPHIAPQNRNQSSVAAASGGTTAPIQPQDLPEFHITSDPIPHSDPGNAPGSSAKDTLSPNACVKEGAEVNKPVTSQIREPPRNVRRKKIVKKTDSMETLEHLDVIKRKATNMMIILTSLYFLTWFPNLLARIVRAKPANLCANYADCWMNGPGYFICSVYINSTVNAFVYCFGSVHFRKQVKFFFKPCTDKLCRQKGRRRVRVAKKNTQGQKTKEKKEDNPNVKEKQDNPVDGEEQKEENPVDGEEQKKDNPVDGEEGKKDNPVDGEEQKKDNPVEGEEEKAPAEAQDGNK